jgi:hypothetical protein
MSQIVNPDENSFEFWNLGFVWGLGFGIFDF